MLVRRTPAQQGSKQAASGHVVLDHQQALLLGLLEARNGGPLSFLELSDAGIEFPASVVSELELAGAPLERCMLQSDGVSRPGVRLTRVAEVSEAAEPAPERRAAVEAPPPAAVGDRRPPRDWAWLAPAVLSVLVAIVAFLVIGELDAKGHHPAATATATRHHPGATRITAPAHPVSHPVAATPPPRVPVSPVEAAELEAHGHELLIGGQAAAAIPVLRRAIAATGESTASCVEPASEACFTYAFALYDLGRALALNGHAASAVPILESRLRINDEREVVAATLAQARQQAG